MPPFSDPKILACGSGRRGGGLLIPQLGWFIHGRSSYILISRCHPFFVIAITSLTALLGLKSTTVTIHRARLMVWGLILEQVPHQAAADDDHPRCNYSHQHPLIKEQMFQRLFGALGSTVHLTHSWGNGGLWRPESLWEVSNKPKNSGLGDCNFNVPMGTWSPKDPNFYEILIGMSLIKTLSIINYRISIKKWSMSTQVF